MSAIAEKGSLSSEAVENEENARGTWQGQFESVLTLVGYSVGIGNIWRFPYLCYKNGGGAFIIPFLLFLMICGLPLFYMEMCLGQFSGKSPMHVWAISPLFRGIGIVMLTVSSLYCWYYGMIIGWVYYYLIQSFFPTLGWSTCNNTWNTHNCIEIFHADDTAELSTQVVSGNVSINFALHEVGAENITIVTFDQTTADTTSARTNTAATEFWLNNVLGLSSGIDDLGQLQWHLVGSLVLGWVVVFFCLAKGVKTVGKYFICLQEAQANQELFRTSFKDKPFQGQPVVYVTVLAPYVLLAVLLVRGVTLNGSWDGLRMYLRPDFERLSDPLIWQDAAVQVFYSLGPAWGGVITMASFNKFHHNGLRDAVIVCFADAFTAIFAGLPVFAVLGYMAKETGKPLDYFKSSGPGLVFIAYPEALSRLPLPQFWSILFFFTLVLVGIDTMFTTFETVSATIVDMYFKQLHKYKIVVVGVLISIICLTSLPLTTSGGFYLLLLMDWYIGTFNVVVTALIEIIIVAWIYGADRFSSDIEIMIGHRPPLILRIIWVVCVPFFIGGINLMTCISFSAPYYGEDGYVFPSYAVALGTCIAFLPLCSIPVVAGIQILLQPGPLMKRLEILTKPSAQWEPNDRRTRELYSLKPYVYETTFLSRVRKNVLGIGFTQHRGTYEESLSMTNSV